MGFSVSDLIFAMINFLVLFAILNKFAFKPLLKVMDARKAEIKQDLEEAAEANAAAQKSREEYLAQLERAKEDAQQIINEAVKAGEKTKEEIIEQAHEETALMVDKARAMIQQEKEEALLELRDEVSTLVVLAAGKLVEESLDEKEHVRLARKCIAKVGDAS